MPSKTKWKFVVHTPQGDQEIVASKSYKIKDGALILHTDNGDKAFANNRWQGFTVTEIISEKRKDDDD